MADKRASPSTDGGDGPKAKRMRKGTKSCMPCRRRKIKCIYDSARPDVCNDCHERGAECIDQERAQEVSTQGTDSQNQTLRGRVSQLEDLVKTLINKLDDNAAPRELKTKSQTWQQDRAHPNAPPAAPHTRGSSHSVSYPLPTPAPSISADTPPSHAITKKVLVSAASESDLGPGPLLGLFQNDIVEAQGGWHEEARTATAQDIPETGVPSDPNQADKLQKVLKSYLPSPAAVTILSRDLARWWKEWSQGISEIFDIQSKTIKEIFDESVRSGSIFATIRALLVLALAMQQIPPDYDYSPLRLQLAPDELADFYVRQVYKLVLSDDEMAGTFEGVESLVILTRYTMNAGRPRKAWLALRRAVTCGQLLNLHRKSSRKTPSHGFRSERKEFLWIELYVLDHVLGLLFGQPYTISPKGLDIDPYSGLPPEFSYMVSLATIASRINDRNQELQRSPLTKLLSITIEIDSEMEELAKTLPADWTEVEDPSTRNMRMLLQFLEAQIRSLLHLPFMLKSTTNKRFQPNKHAAVEESRKMIDIYARINGDRSLTPYVCKMNDFQAFTAVVLLVLNLLGYSNDEDNDEDWKRVQMVMEILRSRADARGGKVSEQCLKTLKLLTSCRDAANDMKGQSVKVMVPFYGTLVLGCGSAFNMTPAFKKDIVSLPTPSTETNSHHASPGQVGVMEEPFIGFDSFANPLPFDFNNSDFFPVLDQQDPLANPGPAAPAFGSSWNALPGAFNMDLDHDWTWYLGSNGTS